MNSFEIISDKKAIFSVDKQMYSVNVVHKVLYWLSNSYLIQSTSNDDIVHVELTCKHDHVNWQEIESNISQMFCDYALREVISEETKDIRNILYIKAFSNVDDFYEYELSGE